jgi:hypothetical protein
LSVDIAFQISRIYHRKSSKDVSITGSSIRLIAAAVLLAKFVATEDVFLMVGQSSFVAIFSLYFIMLIFYRK